jgi:hypothetical protein
MIYVDEEGMLRNHPDAFLSDNPDRRWAFVLPGSDIYYLDIKAGWNKRQDMPVRRSEADAVLWVEEGIVVGRPPRDGTSGRSG